MIDTSVENFTADEAIETGLIEAIKCGETKVAGSFSLDKNGLKINQQKFCFKGSDGFFCAGKFVSNDELWNFFEKYAESLK